MHSNVMNVKHIPLYNMLVEHMLIHELSCIVLDYVGVVLYNIYQNIITTFYPSRSYKTEWFNYIRPHNVKAHGVLFIKKQSAYFNWCYKYNHAHYIDNDTCVRNVDTNNTIIPLTELQIYYDGYSWVTNNFNIHDKYCEDLKIYVFQIVQNKFPRLEFGRIRCVTENDIF